MMILPLLPPSGLWSSHRLKICLQRRQQRKKTQESGMSWTHGQLSRGVMRWSARQLMWWHCLVAAQEQPVGKGVSNAPLL